MKRDWGKTLLALLMALLLLGSAALAETVTDEANVIVSSEAVEAVPEEVVEAVSEIGFDEVAEEAEDALLAPVETPLPEIPTADVQPAREEAELSAKAIKLVISPSYVKLPVKGTLKLFVKTNYKGKIKYSSKNTKVARVSSKGVITARRKGKTVITVKAGSASCKCTVVVKTVKTKDLSKYVGYGQAAVAKQLKMKYGDAYYCEWDDTFGCAIKNYYYSKGSIYCFSGDKYPSKQCARIQYVRIDGDSTYNICGVTTTMSEEAVVSKLLASGWKQKTHAYYDDWGDPDYSYDYYVFENAKNSSLTIRYELHSGDDYNILEYTNSAI